MVARIRSWLVAVLLLCVLSAAVGVATDESNSVCTANDTSEECAAALEENDVNAEDDEDDNPEESCEDKNEHCSVWSREGECTKNPGYMLTNCKRSCELCNKRVENDFGLPQEIPTSEQYRDEVKQIVQRSKEYMKRIHEDEAYADVKEECRNKHSVCSLWAVGSGCDDNPAYMKKNCGPACQSCDYIQRMNNICALDPNAKNAIENGGLDMLFQTMIERAVDSGYDPKVWSRPKKMPSDDGYLKPCEEDVTNPCDVPDGPWVVTLENFISSKEVEKLKEWGAELGYERSQAGDRIVDVRTSAHAWCTDRCHNDPIVTALRTRMHEVTQIPELNSEYLQLLKYEEGQFYKQHNDYIVKHAKQRHGPRLLTFFMYFNEVEEGGGTRFPRLNNLTVEPKQGRVLIWPSVLDEDVHAIDHRTDHEALAVIKGEKFAANAWLHLRDFQSSFKDGCDS